MEGIFTFICTSCLWKREEEASDRLTERDDNNAKKELMLISNVLTLNSPTISPASLIQGGEKRS